MFPIIQGTIRRRLLINYRVDPGVLGELLPAPFRPRMHLGYAVAGICLVRLERMRPRTVLLPAGFASENAAHRVAVFWDGPDGEARTGVFVHRRDTDSWLNHLAGGRIFPGQHRRARFDVEDDGLDIRVAMRSLDGDVEVEVEARAVTGLPGGSIFGSVEEASRFFEQDSVGYSHGGRDGLYDGIELKSERWAVQPLAVRTLRSSLFEDERRFPAGSVEFDHALVMRDVQHRWHEAPDLDAERAPV